ncbi:MAG: hypothetical protein LRY61_01305 [Burkholderiaceae bacterium]|nr:hypothetical protein [Burkholderiaceae bacterium]
MQNAVLFATAYIKDQRAWLTRYKPWIDYYQQSPLGNLPLVLIDDGSPYLPDNSAVAICNPSEPAQLRAGQPTIFHFNDNLGRSSLQSYPGWWRSFLFSAQIARSNDNCKLIHIESDAYVLSPRLFQKIIDLRHGWTTFWLEKYQMPETAIQVICPDQLANLEQIERHPMLNREMAEKFLPFTEIDKQMIGDRYSEFKRNRWIFRSRKFDGFPLFKTDFFFKPIPSNADFATQVVPRQLKDFRFRNPVNV